LYQGESLEMTVSQAANFSGEQQVDTAGKKQLKDRPRIIGHLASHNPFRCEISAWICSGQGKYARPRVSRWPMVAVVDAADVVDDERGMKGRESDK
jgi:hypothetical protein